MISVAVIGYGYWGKNLVRNFYAQKNACLKTVADFDEKKLASLRQNYPTVGITTRIEDVFEDSEIEAVVIATPVFSHYPLAKQALQAGKHVLVEKPFTSTSAQALELIQLAERQGKTLMVDHTFLYTGAVEKMKEAVESGSLGNIQYIDSTRINLGLFQPDVNVLWDLAAHDISICNYLLNEKPFSVQASGISHTHNRIENIAYLTVNYASNKIAHFNCSWTSPVKIRQMLVGGDKKMIVWNDLEPTEKIRIYDTGYDIRTDADRIQVMVDYRTGDVFIPKLDNVEALSGMASDFLKSIETRNTPRSHVSIALTVVKVLEAADESLRQKGREEILVW
jgi:predicted dehydrogenase